jgi:ABC-type nitrate/sulfonate/bicarbonate transport system substrate-binding protein
MWMKRTRIRQRAYRRATRTTVALATSTIVLICASACGGGSVSKGNQVSFVTVKGAIQWWPVEFGIEQGIFKQANLNVSTVQAKSGPEITSIVMSGSADVGMGVLDAAVPPIKQGAKMRILNMPGVTPATSVIVAPSVKLAHASDGYPMEALDLKGLKIGLTSLGSPMQAYLTTVLKDAGVSPKDITPVAVGGPASALAAFTAGKVDALVAYDPMTQMLGEKAYKTVVTADQMFDHATGPANGVYFLASNDFAKSTKAHTFCSAVQNVYSAIKSPANETAAMKSLSDWTGLSSDQSKAVLGTLEKSIGAPLDAATWTEAKRFLSTPPPAYDDAVAKICG